MCGNAIKWAFAVGRRLQYEIGVRRTKEEQCDSGLYIEYDLNYNEEDSAKEKTLVEDKEEKLHARVFCDYWHHHSYHSLFIERILCAIFWTRLTSVNLVNS